MRQVVYMCVQPSHPYFSWQALLWLQSLRDIQESDGAQVILYHEEGTELPKQWVKLALLYPEARIHVYEDNTMKNLLPIYPPLIRPFALSKHFEKYPDLEKKAIFYTDCDILFTGRINLTPFLNDDIHYLSDTSSYLGAKYMIEKVDQAIPLKLEELKGRDPLKEVADIVGIDKQIIIDNQQNTGGAQYLLKDITPAFWQKVLNDTIAIRIHLMNINRSYYPSEEKGYQSWCADMWGVLYNLWQRGDVTRTPKELDFAWSTDTINVLDNIKILHNAGVTGDSKIRTRQKDENGEHIHIEAPAFYKGRFHKGESPLSDMDYLNAVADSPITKDFCNHTYVSFLLKHKDKIEDLYL